MTPYDAESEVVKNFWSDANQAKLGGNIPATSFTVLNSDTWAISFEEDTAKDRQAICQVELNALDSEESTNAVFPTALFVTVAILFSMCLLYSYWQLRQIRQEEAEMMNSKLSQLNQEAKDRRKSRTAI